MTEKLGRIGRSADRLASVAPTPSPPRHSTGRRQRAGEPEQSWRPRAGGPVSRARAVCRDAPWTGLRGCHEGGVRDEVGDGGCASRCGGRQGPVPQLEAHSGGWQCVTATPVSLCINKPGPVGALHCREIVPQMESKRPAKSAGGPKARAAPTAVRDSDDLQPFTHSAGPPAAGRH